MNKAIALAKGLIVSGAILGVALLIADCLECRSASRASVVALCAVVMAFMIGLQFWYLGRFAHSIGWATKDETAKPEDARQVQHRASAPMLTIANAGINLTILALAGIWIGGATTSRYPAAIPLTFFIAGVTTVLLFGAAARLSARVRAALVQSGEPSGWQWTALSIAMAFPIVVAAAMYRPDVLREHPVVGLICGALCFVLASCGVYRSGVTEEFQTGPDRAGSDR